MCLLEGGVATILANLLHILERNPVYFFVLLNPVDVKVGPIPSVPFWREGRVKISRERIRKCGCEAG
jgi:hypothetical protein